MSVQPGFDWDGGGAADPPEPGIGFEQPSDAPAFDGETIEPAFDHERLGRQALAVWYVMADGQWRTLAEIELVSGYPQASISARLRDFRKRKFGKHDVERRRRGEAVRGLFEYRVIPAV